MVGVIISTQRVWANMRHRIEPQFVKLVRIEPQLKNVTYMAQELYRSPSADRACAGETMACGMTSIPLQRQGRRPNLETLVVYGIGQTRSRCAVGLHHLIGTLLTWSKEYLRHFLPSCSVQVDDCCIPRLYVLGCGMSSGRAVPYARGPPLIAISPSPSIKSDTVL